MLSSCYYVQTLCFKEITLYRKVIFKHHLFSVVANVLLHIQLKPTFCVIYNLKKINFGYECFMFSILVLGVRLWQRVTGKPQN